MLLGHGHSYLPQHELFLIPLELENPVLESTKVSAQEA